MPKQNCVIPVEGGILHLPDELMPFESQIAGHGTDGKGTRTFLKHENGQLLKPLQSPPKGTRESGFYHSIYESDEEVDRALRKWIPDFFGIKSLQIMNGTDQKEDYLILEDVSEGLELPNIIDVKIGSRTYGPDASKEKRIQEDAKYKGTKKPLGFSILGIIVHPIRGTSEVQTRYDRSFGKSLKTEEVLNMPKVYFDYENSGLVKELVQIIIDKLEVFLKVYESQTKYHIYGSSLLFAYDAKVARRYLEGLETKDNLTKSVNVKLIDFAHVFPAEKGEKDENFLHGLRNLITVFKDYLKLPTTNVPSPK